MDERRRGVPAHRLGAYFGGTQPSSPRSKGLARTLAAMVVASLFVGVVSGLLLTYAPIGDRDPEGSWGSVVIQGLFMATVIFTCSAIPEIRGHRKARTRKDEAPQPTREG